MPESAQKCKGMQILSNLTLFITFKLPIFVILFQREMQISPKKIRHRPLHWTTTTITPSCG